MGLNYKSHKPFKKYVHMGKDNAKIVLRESSS